MDIYKILQIDQSSSIDEIKYQYKKLAMIHHPDRGGDSSIFLEIKNAYDEICKHRKIKNDRKIIDSDIFKHIEFDFSMKKKQDLTITVDVTLEQVFTGTDLLINYNLRSGETQTAIINIPPSVNQNQIIKFDLGNSCNLKAIINILDHKKFTRYEYDLYTVVKISVFDAMIGCKKEFTSLDNRTYKVNIPAGTQHGTQFTIKNKGFKKSKSSGDLIAVVKVYIPSIDDPEIIKTLTELQDKYIF